MLICLKRGEGRRWCCCESHAYPVRTRAGVSPGAYVVLVGACPMLGWKSGCTTLVGSHPTFQTPAQPHGLCDLPSGPLGNPGPHVGCPSVFQSSWKASRTNLKQTRGLPGSAWVCNQTKQFSPGWSPQDFCVSK